jgi:hypothetical protein
MAGEYKNWYAVFRVSLLGFVSAEKLIQLMQHNKYDFNLFKFIF